MLQRWLCRACRAHAALMSYVWRQVHVWHMHVLRSARASGLLLGRHGLHSESILCSFWGASRDLLGGSLEVASRLLRHEESSSIIQACHGRMHRQWWWCHQQQACDMARHGPHQQCCQSSGCKSCRPREEVGVGSHAVGGIRWDGAQRKSGLRKW